MASYQSSGDFASLAAALKGYKNVKKSNVAEAKVGADSSEAGDMCAPDLTKESISESTEPAKNSIGNAKASEDDQHAFFSSSPSILLINQHRKVVSALLVEVSGSRFYSGSHDYTVAYWDFKGMTRDSVTGKCISEPFRFIEPMGGAYGIRQLQLSSDGQWLLVVGGSSSVRLFDRSGSMLREFSSGDPYIRDLRHTNGHVASVTSAAWLSSDPDRFLTASEDGTVRLWHCGYRKQSEQVIIVKSGPSGRIAVTSLVVSGDSSWWATGSADGTIKLWKGLDRIVTTSANVSDTRAGDSTCSKVPFIMSKSIQAHTPGLWVCALATTLTNPFWVASRSLDGTVKLWDTRTFSEPIVTHHDIPTMHQESSLIFSPDGKWLVAGTEDGCLVALSTNDQTRRVICSNAGLSCVSVAWCVKTEQIFSGWSDGSIRILHQDGGKEGGVNLVRVVNETKSSFSPVSTADIDMSKVYDREAVNSARAPTKRKMEKMRADPIKTFRPDLPIRGPGEGGRIGSSVTQSIMKTVLKDTSRDADPREALLRYAEQAEKNPKWVTPAYQQTQPRTILDARLLEKETRETEERKRRIEEAERLQKERERKGM